MDPKRTITITFGEQVENHVGMQKIGELAENGYSLSDLNEIKTKIENDPLKGKNVKVEIISLKELSGLKDDDVPNAYVLVIKNGVKYLCNKTSENAMGIY